MCVFVRCTSVPRIDSRLRSVSKVSSAFRTIVWRYHPRTLHVTADNIGCLFGYLSRRPSHTVLACRRSIHLMLPFKFPAKTLALFLAAHRRLYALEGLAVPHISALPRDLRSLALTNVLESQSLFVTAQRCPHLCDLTVTFADTPNAEALAALGAITQLTRLCINDLDNVRFPSTDHQFAVDLSPLLGLRNLESFEVSAAHPSVWRAVLTLPAWPRLAQLRVSHAIVHRGDLIQQSRLRKLHLHQCVFLGEDFALAAKSVFALLPHLSPAICSIKAAK